MLPCTGKQVILDAQHIPDIVKLLCKSLIYGIVFCSKLRLLRLIALPGVRPSAVQGPHRICIRSCQQYAGRLLQRKHTVVLEKHLRLHSRLIGGSDMVRTCKIRIIFRHRVRSIEKAETIFDTKNTGHSIVYTRHRYLTLLDKLLQFIAELEVQRDHRHVDSGIDGHLDSLLLGRSHPLTSIEIVDVSPVGHNHSVPVQVLLEPLCKKFGIAVERHSVVA